VGKIHTENKHEKGWYRALAMVVAWLLIVSLARDVWQIRKGFDRISEANRRLLAEEAKNVALKNKMNLVQTQSFKEELIREKLNMQKEDEVLVVMPEIGSIQKPGVNVEAEYVPVWNKWWNLVASN